MILVLATVLAYQQAWHAGYVWDDDKYVTQNTLLTAKNGLKRIWFSLDSPSQYFPLVYTTFRIERALWGLNPTGYHLVNIFLHAANALLLWRLLRILRIPGAWLAAALFALHPVQVESVAWITERKNVLMGFFFLLSLIGWTQFVDREGKGKTRAYLFALVCFALALFSKTTACTLPAALVLILWLKREPINWSRWRQIAPFVALGLLMGLVSVWWERFHQGTQGPTFDIGMVERVLIASRALWFYAWKLIWPAHLSFSYPRWNISAGNPVDYVWLVAVIIGAVALYFFRRHPMGRAIAIGSLFFAATLSPMFGFIMLYTFRYTFVADHYQYLASIGLLTLAAAGLTTAARHLGRSTTVITPLLGGVILLALGWRTWTQAAVYADSNTLWRATLAENPQSWMAYGNLGTALHDKGQRDEAVLHFRKALEINPDSFEAHNNLGSALQETGRLDEAIVHYQRALEIYPTYNEAHYNLGRTFAAAGRLNEAAAQFAEALRANPYDAAAHNRLGTILLETGRPNEALDHFHKIVQLDPGSAEANYNVANALLDLRRVDQSIHYYREALRLNPNYAAAHNNLANTLARSGRVAEAIEHYEKALVINPNDAAAHGNMARALHLMGRDDEARVHMEKARELGANANRR